MLVRNLFYPSTKALIANFIYDFPDALAIILVIPGLF